MEFMHLVSILFFWCFTIFVWMIGNLNKELGVFTLHFREFSEVGRCITFGLVTICYTWVDEKKEISSFRELNRIILQ